MGIFMDITARREAENALRDFNAALEAKVGARTAELRAERARLEAILNSAADGLIVVDEEGRITQANPVAARWLAEVLSPTGADTLRETVRSMVEQAADHPERTLTLGELDLRLQAAPIEDGDDDATAVVSIQDVTALKEVNRIKSRFIEDVSHELRTPTATIKLYADMLSRAPEARRQTYQAALIAEADQLTQLVEDILQLNSIASGDWRSNARPWSLSEIVRQHEGQCQRVVETHDLHFETDLDPDAPEVQIDVTWLVDALCRLVSNAVRYTPPGGQVTIRTGTDTMNERRWATLSVVDTGVGIPEEELPHSFERFYRGDYARDQQISGTGLGLAIVKGVADLHNGRVTVESKVAEGSTFTLWFPMDRPLN
jgi:signal transduction histidine kinase